MRQFHPGDIVSHFKRETADPASKNYLYTIIGTAMHTETEEVLMIYQGQYEPYPLFARPLDMFMEKVDKEKYPHSKQEYRFEKVDE